MATLTRIRAPVELPRRRFTRDEYHAMGESGILAANERVELLGGEIILMSPIGFRHAACVDRLTDAFTSSGRLAGRTLLRVRNPLVDAEDSEPQPDFMLLAQRDDHYDFGHPRPRDVLLLVEVADSSVGYDRHTKLPFYAAAGIRELWIVNLQTDRIESYAEPAADSYRVIRRFRRYRPGESVAPAAFPDLQIAVARIIPGRSPE